MTSCGAVQARPFYNPLMDDLDTPNCPDCLMRMEPVEGLTATFWKCSECGQVKL